MTTAYQHTPYTGELNALTAAYHQQGKGSDVDTWKRSWLAGANDGYLLAKAEDATIIADLLAAAEAALAHVEELEESWSRGALEERDGKGGTRSNRNVDVRVQLQAAIAKTKGEA